MVYVQKIDVSQMYARGSRLRSSGCRRSIEPGASDLDLRARAKSVSRVSALSRASYSYSHRAPATRAITTVSYALAFQSRQIGLWVRIEDLTELPTQSNLLSVPQTNE